MTEKDGEANSSEEHKENISNLNEWGIPNWRDAAAYGDVTDWTLDRWRWEFFRRRPDLRAFFDQWADDTHRRNLRGNAGLRPRDAGF